MTILLPDDSQAAWAALMNADRSATKAMKLPRSRARRQIQRVLDDLLELKRTQPFTWHSPARSVQWFEALTSRIDGATMFLEAFDEAASHG